MKTLTKKQSEIIDNLSPRCEDCKHYRSDTGRMMCQRMSPFLAYKHTQRLRPRGTTMNCGIEGFNFEPNAKSALNRSTTRESGNCIHENPCSDRDPETCKNTKCPANRAVHRNCQSACSPRDFIDGVRELYDEWLKMKQCDDPTLRGLPDMVHAINHVERHGIGPCGPTSLSDKQHSSKAGA